MRLIDIACERRVTVVMFTVAIVLFGMVSLQRLPVGLLPDLSYPTLTIRTELTGAAPIEIENLLTKPIEEAAGVIRNVRVVRSVSRAGQSDVILEFAWGTDMDLAGVDVREKVDILQLPKEATRPVLLRFDPSSEPMMRLALIDTKTLAESTIAGDAQSRLKWLRRFAENRLKIDLEAVEGTAAVKISGGLEDEIQILVDENKTSALGLSVETVAARIRAENINLSGGRLEQGNQRFLVRTLNEFESVSAIANTIIATPTDRAVYLRDIAEVSRGFKEREAITRLDGEESIELAIYKEGDANPVQIAQRVNNSLSKITEGLPEGIALQTLYDQSRFINSAINQVKTAALAGGLLAVLVLYGFLRNVRATVIIGLAIPISVIGTFVLMYSSDLSLNIMSLGGIALAVGLLVDNSIVVLESIVRQREAGKSILLAARVGTSEVATAVIAATLTTVAVFFPMVFVTGVAGQLFRDQALTVTYALLFSLLVALTLIPMLAALGAGQRYSDSVDHSAPGLFTRIIAAVLRVFFLLGALISRVFGVVFRPLTWVFGGLYRGLAKVYPGLLRWSLNHRLIVLAASTIAMAATLSLVPQLGAELIPQLSQGEFSVNLRLPPGTPLSATDRTVQQAQQLVGEQDSVDLSYSVAGTGNRLDANPVDAGENSGELSVRLKPGADRAQENATIDALRESLRDVAGLEYEFARPDLLNFATPLEIELSGYDLEGLRRANDVLLAQMQNSPTFADVRSSLENGNPEVQILFDHERAANLGLAVRDIADEVVLKVRGEVATRYRLADKEIDVLVRSVDREHASIEQVRQLIVNPQAERPVTLQAVADIQVTSGPAEIRRTNQERVAIISASVGQGDLANAAAEAQALVDRTPMPAGVVGIVTGQSEEMESSFNSMRFALIMAVFLVYLVMASQFESLVHPFIILFTIPLALVGAVLALYVTGTTINVVALIGLIMLTGIVVNNAIVLVDFINKQRAAGVEKTQAIFDGGRARLRPILMTTMTTVLGLAPMAMGFGEGAEMRAPMAITVIGGLLVSTLLTLIVIPVVYSLMDRKRYSNAALPIEAAADPAQV